MSSIAVSVIIPVYNAEKYFERCVCSLFEQTLDNMEYVFVNDCSPDNSLEILYQLMEQYPHRVPQVKIINHETNQGEANSRNTGLMHVTGKYVGWVDNDDWVDKEMFAALYQQAEVSNSDIVWCDLYVCHNEPKGLVLNRQLHDEDNIALVRGILYGRLHGFVWNSIAKRQLYIDYSIFFTPDVNLMEDKFVSIQLRFYAQKCTYLPCAYYYHNKMNEKSITMSPDNFTKNAKNGLKTMRSIFSFLETNDKGIDFSQDFVHAKLVFKDYYLHSFTSEGFMIWQMVYPEANKFFLKCPDVPLKNKMIAWLIVHDWWWWLTICIKLRKMIKRFYK